MQDIARRHPGLGLALVAVSPVFFLIGTPLFEVMGNAGSLTAVSVALGFVLVGVLLGLVGFLATRGERFSRRVPAVVAVVLGGLLALAYGLILFMMLTPNAPF